MHIQAEDLSIGYGSKNILEHVSFELEENKIYGLLGRNGTGKTSLLSVLAAFRKPKAGRIMVNGEEPFENAAVMETILFVYDANLEDETEKVKKWLRMNAAFRPNYDHDYADYLCRRFNIPVNKAVKDLSKGLKSAVQVVDGLASRAPLTIFDEAYLGMDAPARELFYEEVLKDYMEHPRTIILSTHLISEMAGMIEEVLIINDSTLLLQQNKEKLLERGTTVTGPKDKVLAFTEGKKRLKEQQLGSTMSIMIDAVLSDREKQQAKAENLELGPVALQELFIHLTEGAERHAG